MGIEANLIKYWNSDGSYQLAMWDSGRTDWRGQTRINYTFWHKGQLIFKGEDFCGSPLHADDSPRTIAALLSFLSLRPSDTDKDYFDNYTPRQMEFAQQHGEELSMLVYEMENS